MSANNPNPTTVTWPFWKTTLLHSYHVASLLANLSSCSFVTFFFLIFFPESYWISFQYILFNDVHFSERIIDWSHRLFILLTHALNVLWLHTDLQWLKDIGRRDYFSSRCALQLIFVTLPIPSLLRGWKRSEQPSVLLNPFRPKQQCCLAAVLTVTKWTQYLLVIHL